SDFQVFLEPVTRKIESKPEATKQIQNPKNGHLGCRFHQNGDFYKNIFFQTKLVTGFFTYFIMFYYFCITNVCFAGL
ncbi:hypothetical protein ACJBXD_11150, partial [Streptococcus suis]